MDKRDFLEKVLPTISLVLIILLTVFVFKPKDVQPVVQVEVVPKVDKTEYKNIDVLVDGKIKNMGFEEYIVHVVAGEMYPDYHVEALKAQAVTARTYTYSKLQNGGCGNGGAQICDDINHCQAFSAYIPPEHINKIENAVFSTKGEIITYEGKPIIALFHSTSGGVTEDNTNVFGQDLPYLKSVASPGEENTPRFVQEEVRWSGDIKARAKATGDTISITERLPSGRVRSVDVFGKVMSGKELREMLDLSSANFEIRQTGSKVTFITTGYGHGVGLSQVGANAMANSGTGYGDIVKHYYTGVEITKISE